MHPIIALLFISVLSTAYGEIAVRRAQCVSGKCLLVKLPKPGPGCKDTAKVTYIWDRFQLVNIRGNVTGCTDGSSNTVYSRSFLVAHPGPGKTEPTHKTLLEGLSVGASKPGWVEVKHQRHDLSTKWYDKTFIWKDTLFTTTIRKGSKTIVEVPQLCKKGRQGSSSHEDKVMFNQLINHTDIKAGDKLTACVTFQLLEQGTESDNVYRFKPVVLFPNMTNEECADFTVGSNASLEMPRQSNDGNCLTRGAQISFTIQGSDKVYKPRD